MRLYKLPFLIIILFNILTLILYIIAPFEVSDRHEVIAILYISINIFMIYCGYISGIRKGYALKSINRAYLGTITISLFNVILVFYLLTFLIRYAYSLYCPPYDLSALFQRVMLGIADPQAGRLLKGTRTISWSIYFLISIVDSVFFLISVVNWKNLFNWHKIIILLLAILDVFFWLATGTNFGIVMLLSTVLFTTLLLSPSDFIKKKQLTKYINYGIILFLMALIVFSHNMEGRAGGDFNYVSQDDIAIPNAIIDNDNFVLRILGTISYKAQILYLYISAYLVQGYYHLEHIFYLDFDWNYFMGSNPALQSWSELIFGYNPAENNYLIKMEPMGIDSYVHWHSCYTWLANDYTIFGVPFVVYYIAKFAATAFVLYRKYKDMLSGVVFLSLANVMIFYFANNNYMSSIFYSFMFFFPIWLFTRYKKIAK